MEAVKTIGPLGRQVRFPGTPNDGSSPYKRQPPPPISPPLPSARGYAPYPPPPPPPHPHLDLSAARFNFHTAPPAAAAFSPVYRDGGAATVYQVVEQTAPPPDFRENDHHHLHHHPQAAPPPPPQQQPQPSSSSYAPAPQSGRRRPSLLPPVSSAEYGGSYGSRGLEGYATAGTSYYAERGGADLVTTHGYQAMMTSGPVDHHHPHHHHHPPPEALTTAVAHKRPRLTIMQGCGGDLKATGETHRPLGLDVDIKREPAYNPQVEAISPTLPPDDFHQDSSPLRASRDELLQQIGKVDREIAKTETQIQKLKKKQQELEMAAAKPDNLKAEPADTSAIDTKHHSVPQIVYAENRKKSQESHETLTKLGPKVELPLYNQPSDTAVYHENRRSYLSFKKRLVAHFRKRYQERQIREKYLTDTYNKLMQQFLKKIERIENNLKRKAKEAKAREFYEKQFPELKKQREDKERFSRSQPTTTAATPRAVGRVGGGGQPQQSPPPPATGSSSSSATAPSSCSSSATATASGGGGSSSSSGVAAAANSSSSGSSTAAAANTTTAVTTTTTTSRKARLTQASSGSSPSGATSSFLPPSTPTRVGTRIRSDAELEEIMDGLQEQELEDKKMRSYAVIPPILLDARQRRISFHNENCLVEDPMAEYKDRPLHNIWTKAEKELFKEKYLQHPKNFGLIASYLERKSVVDCVQYYYLTKKSENYKQLLRKHNVRKKRFPKPQQQQQQQQQPVAPAAPPPPVTTAVPTVQSHPTGVITRQGACAAPLSADESSPSATVKQTTAVATTATAASGDNGAEPPLPPCPADSPADKCGTAPTEGKDVVLETNGTRRDDTKDRKAAEDETGDEQSDDDDYGGVPPKQQGGGGPHPCAVCKTMLEHHGQSRPVTKSTCQLYGLKEEDLVPDARVCSLCRCRSVRNRYTQCPVLTCPTSSRKHKRLRPLPAKWHDLPPEVKEPIAHDLQIPPDVARCCSVCFNRIARRLGNNDSETTTATSDGCEVPPRWTDEEMEVAKHGLRDHGTNWAKIASLVQTKTEAQCKNFYFNYRRKLKLDALVQDNNKDVDGPVPPTVTDEEESGETTSSCEEFNGPNKYDSSDTASAPSPGRGLEDVVEGDAVLSTNRLPPKDVGGGKGVDGASKMVVDEVEVTLTKDLSTSRGSLKSNVDAHDYDSSATVSADEGPSQLDNDLVVVVPQPPPPLPPGGSNSCKVVVVGQNRSPTVVQSPKNLLGGRRPEDLGTPTFLDDARVKALLSHVQESRACELVVGGGGTGGGTAQFLFSGPPPPNSSKKVHDDPELSRTVPGDIVVTKTVRDLIDQAIDTSFPNGPGGAGGGNGRSLGGAASPCPTAAMPHIQDVLRRYEKPPGMKSSRDSNNGGATVVHLQQQHQQQQLLVLPPQHHQQHALESVPQQQQQHHHLHSHQQQHPHHHQRPIQMSSAYHIPQQPHRPQTPPPQPVTVVNYYVPEEQYKAEDLSMKKDRSRDSSGSSSTTVRSSSSSSDYGSKQQFRPPPPLQRPLEVVHRHQPVLGAPPPAHSNQYSRYPEVPPPPPSHHHHHLVTAADAYHVRAEPLTKSPSAYVGDRVPPPPVVVNSNNSQRSLAASPPPHVIYVSQRRSPPLHKAVKGGGGGAPPPLVSAQKPDKVCQVVLPSGGSITHGTPVSHAPPPTPRYEDLVRHMTPPHHFHHPQHHHHHQQQQQKETSGSITLGTPVQHEPMQKQQPRGLAAYESASSHRIASYERALPPPPTDQYYRRVSPQPPPAAYSTSTQAPPGYAAYTRPPYATESQMSSRHTIMTDYYISQQMQARRNSGGSTDKDAARLSPRAVSRDQSPQSGGGSLVVHQLYSYPPHHSLAAPPPPGAYLPPPQSGRRSPSSPPDGAGSPWASGRGHGGSPGLPPPSSPSRGVIRTTMSSSAPSSKGSKTLQGGASVIQSPKPASPRNAADVVDLYGGLPPPKSTSAVPSPRHNYAHGHDAFSALVDVAISQSNIAAGKDIGGANLKHHHHHHQQSAPPPTQHHHSMTVVSPGHHHHLQQHHHQEHRFAPPTRDEPLPPPPPPIRSGYGTPIERHDLTAFDPSERRIRAMYADAPPPPPMQHHYLEYERQQQQQQQQQRYKVSSSEPRRDASPSPQHQEELRRRSLVDAPYGSSVGAPRTSGHIDRDPNKLLFDALEKDPPKDAAASSSGSQMPLTAAKLIDAIISHQISQVTPLRPSSSAAAQARRSNNSDAAGKVNRHSPDSGGGKAPKEDFVTLDENGAGGSDAMSARSGSNYVVERPSSCGSGVRTPSSSPGGQVTLKEHIDFVIHKDYQGEPPYKRTRVAPADGGVADRYAAYAPPLQQQPAEDQAAQYHSWKLRRALQHDKEQQQQRGKSPPAQQQQRHNNPDERQIIRIAQSASPRPSASSVQQRSSASSAQQRSSSYQVEPISPPPMSSAQATVSDGGSELASSTTTSAVSSWITNPNITSLLTTRRVYQPPDSSDGGAAPPKTSASIKLSPLDYVKHKIVEEMRKSSEDGGDLGGESSSSRPTSQQQQRDSPRSGEDGRQYPPGPASQYVPGAIYHHSHHHHHPMDPPPRTAASSYKRTLEVMEASGSCERRGAAGGRSRSISPSSSDVGSAADDAATKRQRLDMPESSASSSSERQPRHLPESSAEAGGGACRGFGMCSREQQQLSSSSDHALVEGSSMASSSADFPQSSSKDENGSDPRSWDDGGNNVVTSGKMSGGGGGSSVEAADSPLSGDMVIDESAAIDSASSSKLEPISPPPQDGISTSDAYSVHHHHHHHHQASDGGGGAAQPVSSSQHRLRGAGAASPLLVGGMSGALAAGISSTVSGGFPATTTYAYPFSALSVRSLASATNQPPATSPATASAAATSSTQPQQQQVPPPAPPQQPSMSSSSRSNSPMSREEPAPLMSSQYEPLSDED